VELRGLSPVLGVPSRWSDSGVNRLLAGALLVGWAGDGFVTFSTLGNRLGRQYVNSCVRDTLPASFGALHSAQPDRTYVVGETGLRHGGRLGPHRSHQNGLSVDIFMPLRNARGGRVLMPTNAWPND
jgi:penicillin-insensitive murein endopeptidase